MRKTGLLFAMILLAGLCGCAPLSGLFSGDRPPSAAVSASPSTGTAPLTVFLNGSGSTDDRGIVSYSWNFGDGGNETTDTPFIEHIYERPGLYEPLLTVTDDSGQREEASVAVHVLNNPPIASFRMSSDSPLPGETVSFDGSSSFDPDGTIVSFTWDFGDGTSIAGAQVSHAYVDLGVYTVRLTVTDDSGDSSSLTHTVQVHTGSPGGCTGGGGVCLGRFIP